LFFCSTPWSTSSSTMISCPRTSWWKRRLPLPHRGPPTSRCLVRPLLCTLRGSTLLRKRPGRLGLRLGRCQRPESCCATLLATRCDTPVSPRVPLKKPNQEPLFHVNQSKHGHQINLSNKEFTKYILKSVMIKTIETFER
jgi:hypothetical protein